METVHLAKYGPIKSQSEGSDFPQDYLATQWINIFHYYLFFYWQEKIRLKYKVSYQVDGTPMTETGEVDSFPIDVQG